MRDARYEAGGSLVENLVRMMELGDTVLLQQAEQLLAEHRSVERLRDLPRTGHCSPPADGEANWGNCRRPPDARH